MFAENPSTQRAGNDESFLILKFFFYFQRNENLLKYDEKLGKKYFYFSSAENLWYHKTGKT